MAVVSPLHPTRFTDFMVRFLMVFVLSFLIALIVLDVLDMVGVL